MLCHWKLVCSVGAVARMSHPQIREIVTPTVHVRRNQRPKDVCIRALPISPALEEMAHRDSGHERWGT